ncbi:chromosome partitioning protein, partial [Xanthomonas sontii]
TERSQLESQRALAGELFPMWRDRFDHVTGRSHASAT